MTDPTSGLRLCADIGGSFVDIAAIDAGGAIRWRMKRPTPTTEWTAFVAIFADALRAMPCGDIALATAGLVDPVSGTITSANIPCIHGRPLARDLGGALGLPVRAVNDADAFVLAEAAWGVARGHVRVFGIILGTGVGGGLVQDGAIVTGAGGVGGEWGHGQIVHAIPGAPGVAPVFACGCGRHGCLDTIGGARGLERLHAFIHGEATTSVAITGRDDPAAEATIACYCDLVGGALAMLLNAVPATIVPVGGGLARAKRLIARLDARVRANMLCPATTPIVVPGMLGDDAALLGAFAAGAAPPG
jgi:N-acetylglucosamine kinase